MSGNVTPYVDFLTSVDSGENNASSIQPITDGEQMTETVLQRPDENLRKRLEVLRAIGVDSLFLHNADRGLVITGPGKITWPGSTTAGQNGIPVLSDNLWILPMLTPGFAQVAPVPPVASKFGVIHLKRVTGSLDSILVTSARRSYAAGDQINITVSAGAVFSCVLDVEDTGVYRRTIKIVAVTGVTTLSTVITALNGLIPPAPDNTQLVTAALENGAANGDIFLSSQARQFMVGNYDGEGHTSTPANLASFFSSNPGSVLAEGDTLCVQFAMLNDTASTGGRRQAIPENSNTTITAGMFFNSRVAPEKLVNALPICKVVNGSLVFGTGAEFAAGTSNASFTESDTSSRVLRNGGFELGKTSDSGRFQVVDWINRDDLANNGAWRINTTTPRSGGKHLELNKTSASATTARIEQGLEIPVTQGQIIRVVAYVKQLIAPTAGVYAVVLNWGDVNSDPSSSSSVNLQVLSSVDGAYRKIDQSVSTPAGKRFLKSVSIEVVGVTSGSTGVALLVDDVQVFVETPIETTPSVNATSMQARLLSALVLGDPLTYDAAEDQALIRYTSTSPAGEGKVTVEHKSQATTTAPALEYFGRLMSLGARLLSTAADNRKSRIEAPFDDTVKLTLMFDSGPLVASDRRIRIYAGDLAHTAFTGTGFIFTVNARYNGTDWVKDVNGQLASAFVLDATSTTGMRYFSQPAATNTWATWSPVLTVDPTGLLALTVDSGGFSTGNIQVPRIELVDGTNAALNALITLSLGVSRRAPVMLMGNGDVAGIGTIDPHGRFVNSALNIEEDFHGATLPSTFVKQDLVGTGTAVTNTAYSKCVITTGGTSGNFTIIKYHLPNVITSSDGVTPFGFSARVLVDLTNSNTYMGYWGFGTALNPDNDGGFTGFKVIDGAVTFVSNDVDGTHTVATGLTLTAGYYWFSFMYDNAGGLRYHVSENGADLLNAYVGGTYGTAVAADLNNGEDTVPFIGVKTTTGSASNIAVDYFSVWSNREGS